MPDTPGEFISRKEFTAFERRVDNGFSAIASQITELRNDIKLASRGPDLKLIVSTLGVFSAIIVAIGSLVAWGLRAQQAAMSREIAMLSDHAQAQERDLQAALFAHVEDNARTEGKMDEQLRALEREVFENRPRRCGPSTGVDE